jgi:hypothetical protein
LNSSWDLDFKDGQKGETFVATILNGAIETVEVKTDRRWKETGNVFVETDCYYQTTDDWRKSGINITKATHYAFVLENAVLIIPTQDLITAIRTYGVKVHNKKLPNPSRGYLIKPTEIFSIYR